MLFSISLDTNGDCTRIIADEWIEITIPDQRAAADIVVSTLQLRTAWEQLLKQRLDSKNKQEQGKFCDNIYNKVLSGITAKTNLNLVFVNNAAVNCIVTNNLCIL